MADDNPLNPASHPHFPFYWNNTAALGSSPQNESQALAYLNFYANLIKESDAYLNSTLNLLDQLGLTQKTVVIKTADHGEMAMAHGGQARLLLLFLSARQRPLHPAFVHKRALSTKRREACVGHELAYLGTSRDSSGPLTTSHTYPSLPPVLLPQ